MVTPVAVSVGVGQTYTTLNAALATLPASTVTADQEWTFNLYTGSVFAACSIPATTTDATHRIIMQPATGQGFKDYLLTHPTAPLRYDASRGVAIEHGGDFQYAIAIGSTHNVIMRGLQIAKTGGHGETVTDTIGTEISGTSGNVLQDCILARPNNYVGLSEGAVGCVETITGCLVYGGGRGLNVKGLCNVTNCTLVGLANDQGMGTEAPVGHYSYGPEVTLTNVAFFGYNKGTVDQYGDGTDHQTWVNSASDNATVESGVTGSLIRNDQLVSITLATFDARVKFGSALKNAGSNTGITPDLYGTARPFGSAYDIGVFESTTTGPIAQSGSNGTGTTVTMPSGLAAGDLILVQYLGINSPAITPPSGFQVLTNIATSLFACVFWKIATGTEGSSLTFTGATAKYWVAARISNHGSAAHPPEFANATGLTSIARPPALTPVWAAKNYLWVEIASSADAIDGPSVGYTNLTQSFDNTSRIATRQENTATEVPPLMGAASSSQWLAHTIAVYPIEAAGGGFRGRIAGGRIQ